MPPKDFAARDLILQSARQYQLNPQIIAAIIDQESSGDPFAIRYEPGFRKRYIDNKGPAKLGGHWPKTINRETELILRSSSIGLMQVMGQVAREQGFAGDSLLELCRPEIAIPIGTKVLASFLDAEGSTEKGLLRYNGGNNRNYPKEVLARIDRGDIDYLMMR